MGTVRHDDEKVMVIEHENSSFGVLVLAYRDDGFFKVCYENDGADAAEWFGSSDESHLLNPPGFGLWVWEGTVIDHDGASSGSEDHDPDRFELEGDWRRPTNEELLAVLAQDIPGVL